MVLLLAAGAAAQQKEKELEGVFGGFGSAKAQEEGTPPAGQRPGEGTIAGQVFDGEAGTPIPGVTVILTWPKPADGSPARIEVQTTDAAGAYEFPSVPPGSYSLGFSKSGYRGSTMTGFDVVAGEVNKGDFPLPPMPTSETGEVLELEPFVAEAETVGEMMNSLELRMDSDVQLNIMSAEDFSKFAASDVADALKRVSGVNVVEGQFAIIRGLEDRYSSTLYNGAPIPSPDPNRQSVQLDLFPSEIVSNLVVSKTFEPQLPSNSAGGSIDIVTHDYPPEFDFKLSGAVGLDTDAWDRFISYVPNSPVGKETDGLDTLAQEYGAVLGGRVTPAFLGGRELRYKGIFNWERDFGTAVGWQEERQPRRPIIRREGRPGEQVLVPGDLANGELNLTSGRYDETLSEMTQQLTGYVGVGFDLDPSGNHRIDLSGFYTRKTDETVDFKENGWLPGYDYSIARNAWEAGNGDFGGSVSDYFLTDGGRCDVCATNYSGIVSNLRQRQGEGATRGALWFTNFMQSSSFETNRNLLVEQINGDHVFSWLDDLHVSWAANHASTAEDEKALGARIFFEPDNEGDPGYEIPTQFPPSIDSLGPGAYATRSGIVISSNDVSESQWFGRLDADYDLQLAEVFSLSLSAGGWYETSSRGVDSTFVEGPSIDGSTQFAVVAPSLLGLGTSMIDALDKQNDGRTSTTRDTSNDANRDIWAVNMGAKSTFWDRFDLLGGVRFEDIVLESVNDPFISDMRYGAPATFPETYLFFDRLDNPARGEVGRALPPDTVFNDQLLGIDVPVDPNTGFVDLLTEDEILSLVNGRIDEQKLLPAAGFAVRPLQGLTWRGSWSQTVARPSFREMGFYATVEQGTDDLVVGNPQLQLSDVTSYDTRVEYVFGELGDLAAFSFFYKNIDKPIESILIRNPIDARADVVWRTWFNNPSTARLWGIELEARKHLDFLGWDFGEYFSIGGNYTYIDARVNRSEAEIDRASIFFRTPDGQPGTYQGLETSRRLFGQPEWIANADITFDQPDWGTRATVAFFAISDILDAAGTASARTDGKIYEGVLDRYLSSYYQLDVVLSQRWSPDFLRGGSLTFKLSAKNLTDSVRGRHYDEAQTAGQISEKKYRVGRDFKFSVTYAF